MKILKLTYSDITDNCQEPLSCREFLQKDCKVCHCVGFLIQETKDTLWLIQDYDVLEKKDVWGMIIPKSVIIKKEVLKDV